MAKYRESLTVHSNAEVMEFLKRHGMAPASGDAAPKGTETPRPKS